MRTSTYVLKIDSTDHCCPSKPASYARDTGLQRDWCVDRQGRADKVGLGSRLVVFDLQLLCKDDSCVILKNTRPLCSFRREGALKWILYVIDMESDRVTPGPSRDDLAMMHSLL